MMLCEIRRELEPSEGLALCAGQLLPISQNQAIFSILGTQFGGDGKSNFALPRLEATDGGPPFYICLTGMYPPFD